jgi:hypothetical protein
MIFVRMVMVNYLDASEKLTSQSNNLTKAAKLATKQLIKTLLALPN